MPDLAELNLKIVSEQVAQATQRLDRLEQQSKETESAAGRLTGTTDRQDRSMGRLGRTASGLAGQIAGVAAAYLSLRGAASGINLIAGFEETLLTVRGVTGATQEQFDALEASARQLGATTRFTAEEAGQGLLFLARAGFEVDEAIGALPATLNLATAGALGLGESADFASNILSQFNISAGDTTRVVDTLVNTSSTANTDVRQLAEAMKFAGPFAASLGLTVEETAAALGVLGDSGIQASLAGTNLRGILASLLGPTASARRAIEGMGLTLDEVNPQANDLATIFNRLRIAGFGAEEALAIVGRRNVSAATAIANNVDRVEELTAANIEAEGRAADLAELMASGLTGSIRSAVSATQELVLSLGDTGLADATQDVIEVTTEVIRIFAGVTNAEVDASEQARLLASSLRVASIALGALTAQAVISSALRLATALGTAAAAGRSLTAALASNPIGLLAVGAGAVIGVMLELNREIEYTVDNVEELTQAVDEFNTTTTALEELQGALDRAIEFGDEEKVKESFDRIRQLFIRESERLRGSGGVIDVSRIFEASPEPLQRIISSAFSNIDLPAEQLLRDLETQIIVAQRKVEILAARGDEVGANRARRELFQLEQGLEATRGRVERLNTEFVSLEGQLAIDFVESVVAAVDSVDELGTSEQQVDRLARALGALQGIGSRTAQAFDVMTDAAKAFLAEQVRLTEIARTSVRDLERENEILRLLIDGQTVQAEVLRITNDLRDQGVAITDELVRQLTNEVTTRAELTQELANNNEARQREAAALQGVLGFIRELEIEYEIVGLVSEARERAIRLREVELNLLELTDDQLRDVVDRLNSDPADPFANMSPERVALINEALGVMQQRLADLDEQEERNALFERTGDIIAQGLEQAAFEAENLNDVMDILRATYEDVARAAFRVFVTNQISGAISGGLNSFFTPNAKGNAFSGGNVVPFADGGVVGGPTLFPMSRGRTGLMGEAGPEAIMPLRRNSRGELGVQAEGRNVVVNQYISTPDVAGFERSRRQVARGARRAIG